MSDVIARLLSRIFQWSLESGEVSVNWTLTDVGPIFKKGRKDDPVLQDCQSHISASWIMDKIILGVTEKHLKDTADISHSQRGFMSNLISFYDKVTHLVDQGKPLDVIFLDFHKAFDAVSHPSGPNIQHTAG